jgi:hypothetical protein
VKDNQRSGRSIHEADRRRGSSRTAVGRVSDCVHPAGCADTYPRDLKVSQFVRPTAGWSVGLVTVTAGGGKVRHDEDYMAETSIKVAPTSWVGTVPTTLWVDGGVVDHPTKGRLMTVRAAGFAPQAFRPGTQWVVQVRNADAWMPNHPRPDVGRFLNPSTLVFLKLHLALRVPAGMVDPANR